MGGKHKKNVRKEKAKVQLKGSKLAKGLNVTKPDFKVRKIVLKTQLNDTGTQRKANIKECITKLKHNNTTIRVDTMKTIKEVLATFPEDIYPKYFGDLLQTCAQLSVDLEKDVRRESFRTLGLLLGTADEQLVTPFFHVLSSYLRCAMTHLNQWVQEDSLLLLDIMLEHMPTLVARNHAKIFEYFLDLISKMRSESKPGRTLSLQLGKKTTNVKWRCRVLERLLAILRCINETKSEEAEKNKTRILDLTEKFIAANEEAICIDARRTCFAQEGNSLWFLFQTDYGPTVADGDRSEATIMLKKSIELIVPLLNESWMETRPETIERGPELQVDKEATTTLYLITAILGELWTRAVNCDAEHNQDVAEWFRERFAKDFYELYVDDFPHRFQQQDARQQDNRMSPTSLNAAIANIFCNLTGTLWGKQMLNYAGNVLDWMIKTVNQKLKYLDEVTVSLLLRTIKCAVLERIDSWSRAGGGSILKKIKHLVQCLVKAAMVPDARGTREKIAVFLSEIILNNEVYSMLLKEELNEWVIHLPETLLQKNISVQLMDTLLRLGTHGDKQFLDGIRSKKDSIQRNLKNINIFGTENLINDRKKLNDIMYWMEPQPMQC